MLSCRTPDLIPAIDPQPVGTSLHITRRYHIPVGLHIAHGEAGADGMTEHAGSRVTADTTVPQDRFIVIDQRLRIDQPELYQTLLHTRFLLSQQGITPLEATGLVELHGEAQSGLQRRFRVRNVVTPVTVALFHAQAVQCVITRMTESETI